MEREKSLFRYQHFHRDQPMKAYNPPSRIGRAARSVRGDRGWSHARWNDSAVATIIVATLVLHGFEPLPCRAQAPPYRRRSPPRRCRRPCRSGANSASPAGERLRGRETEASPARADRPSLSDQPRHRPATLRRPAADRGRRAGECVGGRSTAHAGQGPLGSSTQHRLRLYPTRWRRPGFQQGHHDRAERELFLRRCRPVGDRRLDRCRLRAPGRAAGLEFAASRTFRPPRTTPCS